MKRLIAAGIIRAGARYVACPSCDWPDLIREPEHCPQCKQNSNRVGTTTKKETTK